MPKTIHLKMSIRGALRQSDRELDGLLQDAATGRQLTPYETRQHLIDLLEDGQKYLPMGDCPNFDPIHGCPGHETE